MTDNKPKTISSMNSISSTGQLFTWSSPYDTWAQHSPLHTHIVSTPPSQIPPHTHGTWTDNHTTESFDPSFITIHDENGMAKTLSIVEVSRYYSEALEYRKIKRFARLFPMVRELLNELLIAIKVSDPYDEEELCKMEEELKEKNNQKD